MKYFVVSDIHGFYDEMMEALNEAGFDKNNKNHTLIICGDLFDRGLKPLEIMDYVNNLERVVLIKGNHELMLENILKKNEISLVDEYNGCTTTVYRLLKRFGDDEDKEWKNTRQAIKEFHDKFVNFFETEHYIFVHAWIPVSKTLSGCKYNPKWRNIKNWEKAVWYNPFNLMYTNKTKKTIVFGHRMCSVGWQMDKKFTISNTGEDAIWDIWKSEEHDCIAIDRCTPYTGKVNVLVVED